MTVGAQNIRITPHFKYCSHFIEMKDGVKLAIDLFLPKKIKKEIPTVLFLTRYVRSFEPKDIIGFVGPIFGQIKRNEIVHYIKNGYAVIIVDVRGTGASFGSRKMEFSPQEVEDGAQILDWIVAQAWSNGKVGTTGISYLGTTAEFILTTNHPALQACVPRSSIFDLYGDIVLPGGIRHGKFVEVWRDTTRALDTNDFGHINPILKMISKGPKMIGNKGNKEKDYEQAQNEHKENFDIFEGLFEIENRDDINPKVGHTVDTFSIHNHIEKIQSSETPIFRIGGWYDGALGNSLLKGFQKTNNTVLARIGPWDHGPAQNVSPFVFSNKLNYDVLTEITDFFDLNLKENTKKAAPKKTLWYYTMGEEKWHKTHCWPPSNVKNETWFLSQNLSITKSAEKAKPFQTSQKIDETLGTGGGSRWNSLTIKYRYKRKIGYFDRHKQAPRMMNFLSEIFNKPFTITGHPFVEIMVKSDAKDLQLFAYLEEILPDGKIRYITEGMIRGTHRKTNTENQFDLPIPNRTFKKEDRQDWEPNTFYPIHFDLFAISYQVQKGSRIKIAFAGADIDHFHLLENEMNATAFTIKSDESFISKLVLPVI
jgi:putative CocE/NonD family hydrolase